MSLYADAVNEKYGLEVYEENGIGFFTYSVRDKQFFIEEFYISPKFRSQNKGVEFLNKMIVLAKNKNCNSVVISIFMYVKNDLREATAYVALKNRFKFLKSTESHIFLERVL